MNWSTLTTPNAWGTLTNVHGNGTAAQICDADAAAQSGRKVYRVFAEAPLRYLTVGHVGPITARLAVGLDAARELRLIYSTNANLSGGIQAGPFPVAASNDFTRSIDLIDLEPGTRYYYNPWIGGESCFEAPYPSFVTAPMHGTRGAVKIAFGSCYVGTSGGGHGTIPSQASPAADRIWRAIGSKVPDFFVHLGDTAYCDSMRASDLNSYRLVHRHSLDERLTNNAGYAQFRRHFASYTTWDDHEIGNDWPWSAFASSPWSANLLTSGKQAFKEYHGRGNPTGPQIDELYYSFQFGDIGVFMTDTRSFRSCQQGEDSLAELRSGNVTITFNGSVGTTSGLGWNGGVGFTTNLVGRTLRLSNGQTRHIVYVHSPRQISVFEPWLSGTFTFSVLGKTLLGNAQKERLKNWLLQSKDSLRFKFIGTATPINGLSEHITRKDAWGAGYEAELNEILDFTVSNQIRNVVFLSGDQHWAGSFKRQRGGVNFFEFMSSPLSSSFHPRYTGTNSTLLSRVNWMFDGQMNRGQVENFGLVTARTDIAPATLTFELFDAQGALLNSTTLRETFGGLELAP